MDYRLKHRYLPISSDTQEWAAEGASAILFENLGTVWVDIYIEGSARRLKPGQHHQYKTIPGERIFTVWEKFVFDPTPTTGTKLLFITKEIREEGNHGCRNQ